MSIAPKKFRRKTFVVDAVRVTIHNMEEVAEWCGGEVLENEDGLHYVKIKLNKKPSFMRPEDRAYVGFWVLKNQDGVRVYKPKAFEMTFDLLDEEKYLKVLELIVRAMHAQKEAEYLNPAVASSDIVAQETARRIIALD